MFENVAFVWGENVSDGPLTASPSVTVALWPEVLGCASLRWREGQMPDISRFDVFLVNLFHTADSTHIRQIREAKPDAVIVAMPDPSIDLVLLHPQYMPMLEQMALADWIGGRTEYDCQVYGTLLQKPSVWLPSPIGPTEWFAQFRELPKEEYIVALDHPMEPYASAHNVAALADVQRATGLRVIYAAAREATKQYARLAGLEAEWHGHISFPDFVEMTARARLCIDLYLRHSYHRHAVMCAMVGTPCAGSQLSEYLDFPPVPPLKVDWAVALSLQILGDQECYEGVRHSGFRTMERLYAFDASRRRMAAFLGKAL